MIKCEVCNAEFINAKVFSNHVRWKHKRSNECCVFCKKLVPCNRTIHEAACYMNPVNIKYCLSCSQVLATKNTTFCSHACAAAVTNTTRQLAVTQFVCKRCHRINDRTNSRRQYCAGCSKLNIAETNAEYRRTYKYKGKCKLYDKVCIVCASRFKHSNGIRKTCNAVCLNLLRKQITTNHPNCGGETNFKRFTYRDLIFDSSWEVAVAQHMDSLGVDWIRDRKCILWWVDSSGKRRRYYPDFYLPKYDTYVDPKNPYKAKCDAEKINYINSRYNLITGNIRHCNEQISNLKLKRTQIQCSNNQSPLT